MAGRIYCNGGTDGWRAELWMSKERKGTASKGQVETVILNVGAINTKIQQNKNKNT